MNTNLNTQIPVARSLSSEGWAAVAGVAGSALLLAKKLFASKAPKLDPVSKGEFYAELLALKDQMHAQHVSLLEKLEGNHRELLAALERLGSRVSAVEAGLARVEERTNVKRNA